MAYRKKDPAPTVVPQQIDTLSEWVDVFPILDRMISHQLTYSYAVDPGEENALRLFLEEIRKPR